MMAHSSMPTAHNSFGTRVFLCHYRAVNVSGFSGNKKREWTQSETPTLNFTTVASLKLFCVIIQASIKHLMDFIAP